MVRGWMVGLAGVLFASLATSLAHGSDSAGRRAGSGSRLSYPAARRVDQVDDFHGTRVADPYRWLEDADSEETRQWVEAQNRVTAAYLSGTAGRERIRKRLTVLMDYERHRLPWKEGRRYFFERNSGLQNQDVLYTADSLAAPPRVLLDPNTLSPDGTVALAGRSASRDGKLLAYAVSAAGSDWQEWRVRDTASGEDFPDRVRWSKFSGASWTADHRGFFYSRYDAPAPGQELQTENHYQKLYYHRLGTPQSEDLLVYHRPDQKEWGIGGSVTEDGRYLLISARHGTRRQNRIFYQNLQHPQRPRIGPEGLPVTGLLTEADAQYLFLGNDGPVFWFRTDHGAPRGRVIAIDTRRPGREHWRELVPEAPETLEGASVVGDQFIAVYLKDARSVVRRFSLDGKPLGELALPGLGTAGGFRGKPGDPETFYQFSSYTRPGTIYRYDTSTAGSTLHREPNVAFRADEYETRQVFYRSKDGTRVPMFLTHRKGLKRNGRNPVYLTGYGGFRLSQRPGFSSAMAAWMELGGVYAVPNLRGGGEYGREWYEAGIRLKKQNVFDDFIAAAEHLVREGYTRPDKLAIAGGSNGGLLVGACMTQRPELFGAALPAVGVMDMLRFHRFTIGHAWTSDYGSPDDPTEFAALHAYSPYHNLRPGTRYPATLVTTSDHDDRVVPAHSYKFAAALQAAHAGETPVLIRVETQAGHGAGKPVSKQIEEWTDRFAFLSRALGVSLTKMRGAAAAGGG